MPCRTPGTPAASPAQQTEGGAERRCPVPARRGGSARLTASVDSENAACPVASPWACASATDRSATPHMSHFKLKAAMTASLFWSLAVIKKQSSNPSD